MAKNKTTTDEKLSDKKKDRLLIEEKLSNAFSDLKPVIGKKTFEKKIKKAAKAIRKKFSRKAMESIRKQYPSVKPEKEIRDDTNLLIEELP